MTQVEMDLIAKAIRNNGSLTEKQKEDVANDIADYQLKYDDPFFNKKRFVTIAKQTFPEGWPNRMDPK